ncbi:MAG: adenylate/guanylate cyclase domain-containing protein, partial [Lentisphaerae bacterium]|nr:adenylate/guanylate cyclase domain-containing protein [Lentisphaerota bacterium]
DEISFADVAVSVEEANEDDRAGIAGKYKPYVDGRMIVIATAVAGIDVGACPLAARTPLVLTHLIAADNILSRRFLVPSGPAVRTVMFAVLFCLFTTLCVFQQTTRLGAAAAGGILLYVLAAYGLIHAHQVILPVAAPIVYIAVSSFGVLSYKFLTEERAKKRIRKMFSTMVSDEVLAYLEENPESFSPRGHTVEATVFFSDVANFTTISETLPPDRLIELLNSYLTPVTDNILKHGGCIDKYIGDSVMALWGAPYPSPNHAADACVSAIEQQQLIDELNTELIEKFGLGLGIRMGINSGAVTAGNMGSERKLQYTVLGDTVNLASRLEPANKDFGTRIIVGETTWRMAREAVEARPLGRILLVGKMEVVSIYELLGIKGQVDAKKMEAAERHGNALAHFYERRWDHALSIIDSILLEHSDGPTIHLRERVLYCRANPPGEAWRGEYVRQEKD